MSLLFNEERLLALIEQGVRNVLDIRGDELVDAKSSGIGPAVFRAEVKAGRLPAFKVGKRWVTRRRDLDAWITAQRVSPRSAAKAPANDMDPDVAQLLASGRYVKAGSSK